MTRAVDGAVVVLGDDGKPREGVSLSAFVAELRQDDRFAGTGKSGVGAN
jgi:hypothetical protein